MVFEATQQYLLALKNHPHDINLKLDLASCYFYAGYFDKGSPLFKTILSNENIEDRVKVNIAKFIERFKYEIESYRSLNQQVNTVLDGEDSASLKIEALYYILMGNQTHQFVRLKLISLLLKMDRADEVFKQLDLITPSTLDTSDHKLYLSLMRISENKFSPRSYFSGLASMMLGYDDNVGGIASNDIYEEDDLSNNSKLGGVFSRWYGSLRYNVVQPKILDGERSHTDLGVLSVSMHERRFFDEEGEPRNYNIIDGGITYGRKNKDDTQLLLPLSIKRIKLNGEDYAQYLDAKLRYTWKPGSLVLSLTERFSHRDYSLFDEDRQNANLYEGSFGIGLPINGHAYLNAKVDYTLLDTTDEEFRSYERFTYSLGATFKTKLSTAITFGMKYQNTDYRGVNEKLFIPSEECIDEECELVYDFIRSDTMSHYFIESNTRLNTNLSIKTAINVTNRDSNQELYTYSRKTLTVGLHGKF